MARSINRLTDRTVKSLTTPGRHADGGNLFLVVDPVKTGADPDVKPAKRWAFLFRWQGKLTEMGLGSVNSVGLANARDKASHYRAMLEEAVPRNPIEVRRAEQAAAQQDAARTTFGAVATQLHKSKEGGWKNQKYAAQWLRSLKVYAEPIWSKPVDSVNTEDVLAVLLQEVETTGADGKPIKKTLWSAKAETARKTRSKIEIVLDAARALGMIAADRANPARFRGHLSLLLPKRQRLQKGHHAALPYAEMPAFVGQLRQRQAIAALCLEFTTLTAARSGESMGARWGEIDMAGKLWLVPRVRMGKTDKPHRLPLSDRCMAILREVETLKVKPDGFVFPGQKPGRPLSVMALEMLLRRMEVPVTVHGFRSTFRDWAGDCTTFPREIVEVALSHQVGDEVEQAYRRGDALEKRRRLMQAWADYCGSVKADNVLPMRRASAA